MRPTSLSTFLFRLCPWLNVVLFINAQAITLAGTPYGVCLVNLVRFMSADPNISWKIMKCEFLPVISFIKVEFSDRLLFAENICVVHLKLQVDSVFVRSDQVESCCRKDRWIRFVSLHLVYYPFEKRALFSSDTGKDRKELWRQTLPRSWRIPLVCSPHVWVVVLNVDFIVTFFDTYGLLTLRTIQKPCNDS